MSLDATTASGIARHEPERSSDSADKLSFAYFSLLLSALFNLFFLLFTACTAASFCILVYQAATYTAFPSEDQKLLVAIVVSLVIDLLYFSLRLHNRATSPNSTNTYAAYFREKPASLLRLWGRSSHHRRLFIRWQGALRWMVPLDMLAIVVCVIPVHSLAQPMQLYTTQSLAQWLDVYHQMLTAMSLMLEMVVALEVVLDALRRCCGPTHPNVLMWQPETGHLTPVHPHEYQEALIRQQQQSTPPHHSRGVSTFVADNDHPVYAPPAYGHQDVEDAYNSTHQQQQPRQPLPYHQQQPHMQHSQSLHQPYARLHKEQQVEDEGRLEGQPRHGKGERDNGGVEGSRRPAAAEEEEGEEGEGEGGELGAATAPLVMMMSPALMDEDGATAASRPRVMLNVRPSDADRAEVDNPRRQALSSPRYAVVHMSST